MLSKYTHEDMQIKILYPAWGYDQLLFIIVDHQKPKDKNSMRKSDIFQFPWYEKNTLKNWDWGLFSWI